MKLTTTFRPVTSRATVALRIAALTICVVAVAAVAFTVGRATGRVEGYGQAQAERRAMQAQPAQPGPQAPGRKLVPLNPAQQVAPPSDDPPPTAKY